MDKRLSANAPQPRSRITLPGYPTLAAAGLCLCLSSGCTPKEAGSPPAPFDGPPEFLVPDIGVPDAGPPPETAPDASDADPAPIELAPPDPAGIP
jgi:hypothetical protein